MKKGDVEMAKCFSIKYENRDVALGTDRHLDINLVLQVVGSSSFFLTF